MDAPYLQQPMTVIPTTEGDMYFDPIGMSFVPQDDPRVQLMNTMQSVSPTAPEEPQDGH